MTSHQGTIQTHPWSWWGLVWNVFWPTCAGDTGPWGWTVGSRWGRQNTQSSGRPGRDRDPLGQTRTPEQWKTEPYTQLFHTCHKEYYLMIYSSFLTINKQLCIMQQCKQTLAWRCFLQASSVSKWRVQATHANSSEGLPLRLTVGSHGEWSNLSHCVIRG